MPRRAQPRRILVGDFRLVSSYHPPDYMVRVQIVERVIVDNAMRTRPESRQSSTVDES